MQPARVALVRTQAIWMKRPGMAITVACVALTRRPSWPGIATETASTRRCLRTVTLLVGFARSTLTHGAYTTSLEALASGWQTGSDCTYYARSPDHNPPGPAAAEADFPQRVIRGNSWDGPPDDTRVSRRGRIPPDDRYSAVGLRCVLPS